jgi:hypothetical protein
MARSTSPDSKKRQAKRQQLLRKLRNKYRAVLINESTYEERFSFRLSRFNVILLALLLFTLHGLFVLGLIIFTPLKEYIPGYSNQKVKLNAYRAMTTADSLDQALKVRDAYINNLRNVLSGNLPADSATLAVPLSHPPTAADLKPSIADSLLRAKVREEEAFSVHAERGNGVLDHLGLPGLLFFPPMRGIVTSTFDRAEGHYGIDIVTKADEAVKACLGRHGDRSPAGPPTPAMCSHDPARQRPGERLQAQRVLLKKVGDRVKAGEAIAIVGNSGELHHRPASAFRAVAQRGTGGPAGVHRFK